jgi:hypothetical protein
MLSSYRRWTLPNPVVVAASDTITSWRNMPYALLIDTLQGNVNDRKPSAQYGIHPASVSSASSTRRVIPS